MNNRSALRLILAGAAILIGSWSSAPIHATEPTHAPTFAFVEENAGSVDTSGYNLAGVSWEQAAGLLQTYSARGGYQASNGQVVVPGMMGYQQPVGWTLPYAGSN